MCLAKPKAIDTDEWPWEGERIIHECIVPSSRPVVGYRNKHYYDIDVREFLLPTRNEVIKHTLETHIRKFLTRKSRIRDNRGDWEYFQSRDRGAFDFKADTIVRFVSETIAYTHRPHQDPWQFPDETLSIKNGDCEDIALLIASLLIASGISSYNVRVALGKMSLWNALGKRIQYDHVWVMYKNEAGRWRVIEPQFTKKVAKASLPSTGRFIPILGTYVPQFVFNDAHLWEVSHSAAPPIDLKKTWSELHPSFSGQVHRSILEQALPASCPAPIRTNLLNRFTLLGYVDPMDTAPYDPIDHFDNGLIQEGWARVAGKLSIFKADSSQPKGLDAFFHAAHSIGDFYAHSSFCHFARSGSLYDPADEMHGLPRLPAYNAGTGFDPSSDKFSANAVLGGSKQKAIASWQGKIISGRYAQKGDRVRGGFEKPPYLNAAQLPSHAPSLPHHEEIAVDGGMVWDGGWKPGGHELYDTTAYWQQLGRRKQAAISHIRKAFLQHYTK
jgi:hypothetical protein